nr:histone deacetylase 14 [Tanacetum cinerariifolium]
LDETRFTLDSNLLREVLEITPIDQARQFVSHPSASPFHLAEEDFKLGNLKFVPKGEIDEVFGMPIPDELISNNIRNAPYYNAYLEMVAKHDLKMSAEKEGKKKTPPKPKPAKEKSTKTTLPQPTSKGKVIKVRKAKSQFQLVDEPNKEPAHSEPEPKLVHEGKVDEDDMELAIRMKASTGPSAQPLDDTSANIVRDSPSPPDAERGARSDKTSSGADMEVLQITEELAEDVGKHENIKEKTEVMDEDQARPDPGESGGALAGPDPEPMHEEFMVDLYPKDAFAIGDQFINEKSTEDESEKPNVEAEAVSMVTVLIYQASSSVPSPSTPIPAQRDEFLAEKDKSRKRRRDDQDPHPPPLDSDISKRRRHDTDASEDTDSVHLPKTKQRPKWFKPNPDNDRPATLEPAWVIPTSHILDVASNWANALSSTYQAPAENSLLAKTGDMWTFMHWYCQKMGKTELTQVDFEGQAYEVVKAFYPNVVHLQFQMEECHKMLTDQVDWANPEGDQVRIYVSKPLLSVVHQDLSISKMKATRYLDFGLELRVPEHMWINEVKGQNTLEVVLDLDEGNLLLLQQVFP